MILGIGLFLSVIFFTSIVDLTLGRAGLMPVQPTFLAIVVVGFMALIVFINAIRLPIQWRRLTSTVQSAVVQFACYAIIAVTALLGAALPGAYWIDNSKWILLIPYGFVVWLATLVIMSDENLQRYARAGLIGGFVLHCGSVIYEIFFPASFSNLEQRASGFAGNSNFGALATCMLCASVLGFGERRTRARDLFFLCFTATAVLATQSRSGIIEFSVLLAFWIGSCFTDKQFSVKEGVKLFTFTIITFVTFGFILSFVLHDSVLFSGQGNRFSRMISGKAIDDGSSEERVRAAADAMRLISEAPVLGHGTGYTRTMHVMPHNQYLQQWVNNGLVGLLAYLALLLTSVVTFLRRRNTAGLAFICVTLIGSVFSHNVLDQRSFIMTFAILLGMSEMGKSQTKSLSLS